MNRATEFVKTILSRVCTSPGFGQCMKKLEIVSAGDGNCKAKLVVSEEHLNMGGFLHGGFTSTIIDCVSTYALMTYKDSPPGLSVDLHVTFMKPALPGETIVVDAKTIRAGKRLAFLSVDITKNDGKDIVAQGRQTKFIGS
ncbi:acyl-coenzyme A thioesterase 13 [Halictus rubicundus]|uniref:acyl-coenzyme A thioesterase 13 n=1 Tax=Halictus rubicundus TaxID=77578 RepID=UPI004036C5D7